MKKVNSHVVELPNILADMKTIGERLKEARHAANLSQEALARRAGVTQGLIGQIENGRNKGSKHAAALARALNVSADWLESGTGPKERPASSLPDPRGSHALGKAQYNPPKEGDNFEAGPDIRTRPYPEISWVQAGMWTEICENFEAGPEQEWHFSTVDLGPCGFVVRVKGYSMTAPAGMSPSFPNGTLLFVRPDADAEPGKFVIVRRNGNEATFKRLIQIEGQMFLEALNPDWPNRVMRLQPDDVICGVVREARIQL